jgi:acyl-CoA synthetase (NDP forming)
VNAEVRAILDKGGIPYLSGLRPALAAMRNLAALKPSPAPRPAAAANSPALPVSEPACFQALRDEGVPMVASERVGSAAEAVAAAERLGYPVAMKGVAPHLPHKSDLGLVRLKLANAADVRAAFDALNALLAKNAKPGSPGEVVVQKMAEEGVELILGIRNQKGFGSFVIVGPGGVLVEIANQASVRLGPVDEAEARAMLNETAAGKLLGGVRGKPPGDIDAAARVIAAFSRIGAAQIDRLSALEINPLIVGPRGAAGVDVLLEPFSEK